MNQSIRELNALMINHLIEERQRIEDASDLRIDRDLKLTYDFITEEIARLNLEIFQARYQQYESNLNKVLKIESGDTNVVS
jgi:hypothetical protein